MSEVNNNQAQDLSELLQIRRDKLADLQRRGKDPFKITKYDVSHHSEEVKKAVAELEGKTVRVFAAKYTDGKTEKVPGAVVSTDKGGLEIACADGETLLITELQAPGKKRMGAEDYLRGHQIKVE